MTPAVNVSPVPVSASARPRRRRWPWIVGLCLAPFLLLLLVVAIGAFSFLTLDRSASALRKEVMTATGARWHTKIQLSVGPLTLGAVRTGMSFAPAAKLGDARLALAAVRSASVGVYEVAGPAPEIPFTPLLSAADAAMARRGWTRMVGVTGQREKVLVYAPSQPGGGEDLDVCVAVVDGRQLVIVAATVNAEALGLLAEKQRKGGWPRQFLRLNPRR